MLCVWIPGRRDGVSSDTKGADVYMKWWLTEEPSSLSYTEVAMPLVNLLVEVLQVVLKYFFQTISILLNEAKVGVSSI